MRILQMRVREGATDEPQYPTLLSLLWFHPVHTFIVDLVLWTENCVLP